ncbi:MAG: phosphoribosylformylglycinamidine synthase subunit PurQ [Gemmatimonadota bacterium]|nr:phosphoribosylformylglycinamidine synthase subunit PurQ [Gemmatimonadota bacterium]
MKVAILTFPGSNCDQDCYHAMEMAGGAPHYVWHRETDLNGADAVVVPGGFAHGDYLRPGAIARFSPIMESVVSFARGGGLVIGICNGFQILCEAGLLPGALLRNRSLKFQSHVCHLRVETAATPFTTDYEDGGVIRMPLSHADGNYYADADTLQRIEDGGQVIFRYCTETGEVSARANPNGALSNIAGIVNDKGNVLGMMPHPDRAVEAVTGSTDGLPLFTSMVAARVGLGAA